MERDLNKKIKQQEQYKIDLDKKKILVVAKHAELEKKRMELIETKDTEIRELKERIEEMSSDFSSILRDTLQKLNESVITESTEAEWVNERNGTKCGNLRI